MRSVGRIPSRLDLEGFFTAVHHVKPLKESDALPEPTSPERVSERMPLEDQRKLDITTRPPSLSQEEGHHTLRM